jgi:hypothetical protein
MTIRKSHLQIALAVLVLSVAYNFWVYLRPARPVQAGAADPSALEAQISRATIGSMDTPAAALQNRPGMGAVSSDLPAIGSIAPPPAIDLATPPSWKRDPFLFGNETRREAVPAAAAVPDPIVRSILFSANRRLAVVDGKIVGIGDALGTSRVVDITRDAVVFKTASGEQRRVGLHGQPPPAGIRR